MHTNFRRQTWGFDSNYIRVEALDDERRPIGYVFFIRRPVPAVRERRPAPALVGLLGLWVKLRTCFAL